MNSVPELLAALPDALRERVMPRQEACEAEGEFVLCWLHHALRARANPALDAAAGAAASLGCPLLVYQGLGGEHPYNSDRHHRFILEAARDLGAALGARGHRLFFHLPADPGAPSPLPALARRAALVVTELYPVPPFSAWYRRALERATTPWWFVDACCVVPMTLSRKRHDRAFAFRRAWQREYEARAARPWPEVPAAPAGFAGDPGFVPFDLGSDLAEAVAACRIDHGVGPIGHTRGGSAAARDRWDTFRARGLAGYAGKRNDAAVAWPRGVSRLSPYLHYGCISSLEIAPELTRSQGKGPEKLLDELLIWRELAHHFCFRAKDPNVLEVLPAWAQETLRAHRADRREQLLDWEALARGRSGDALWDLAQHSLLRHGELHNNVRMTWGKGVLQWTDGPEEALARLLDLNHRYALDGNDPNSYGGILWCLGAFDRPFEPEQPIVGTVRPRSTEAHARRLDLPAYRRKVLAPAGGRRLRCVVLGAGISGLAAARTLADHGHEVRVLDKGRGPGGRASTRRRDSDGTTFDHGAQYFTARDPRFRRYVDAWRARGLVAAWAARIGAVEPDGVREAGADAERLVGVPGMSALAAHLAEDLEVRYRVRVEGVRREAGALVARTADGDRLEADIVVASGAPEAALPVLAPLALPTFPVPKLRPCWAVLLEASRPLFASWDGLFVNTAGPLAWLARQAGKPGRGDREAWVLHASAPFSEAHLEAEPATIATTLVEAVRGLPGAERFEVLEATAHRWRYAQADEPLDRGALWFEDPGVVVCGDWLHGSRIEGAFLSGMAAAGRVLGSRVALGR